MDKLEITKAEVVNGSLFGEVENAGDTLRTLQEASRDIRRVASKKAIAAGLESVRRAQSGTSIANDMIVVATFAARGIPEGEIKPRENVFTFNGWKAQGRYVRKGEHGCKLTTYVPTSRTDDDGETEFRAVTTHVFHVSQTEAFGVRK